MKNTLKTGMNLENLKEKTNLERFSACVGRLAVRMQRLKSI